MIRKLVLAGKWWSKEFQQNCYPKKTQKRSLGSSPG